MKLLAGYQIENFPPLLALALRFPYHAEFRLRTALTTLLPRYRLGCELLRKLAYWRLGCDLLPYGLAPGSRLPSVQLLIYSLDELLHLRVRALSPKPWQTSARS